MQSSTAQVSNANVPDIYAPLAATPMEIDDYFSLGKFGSFSLVSGSLVNGSWYFARPTAQTEPFPCSG